jgi:hypothetical protein
MQTASQPAVIVSPSTNSIAMYGRPSALMPAS